MSDIRSKLCVFTSHCMLAQAIRAEGLAKHFKAAVKPVVQFCLDHDINIMQMPCPESMCASGGLGRSPHGKKWYEDNGLRETASKIAKGQVQYMKSLVDNDYHILAIMGVEFSPACSITYLNRGPVIYKDQGIYIEELNKELAISGLEIPMIGVNNRAHRKLEKQLNEMISGIEVASEDIPEVTDEQMKLL